MALTLDDIQGMPNDPYELNQHLLDRGLITPPPQPAAPTLAPLSPVKQRSDVADMTPPEIGTKSPGEPPLISNTKPLGPVNPNFSIAHDPYAAMGAASTPRAPGATVANMTPPEIANPVTGGAAPAIPTAPLAPLRAPTKMESREAWQHERATERPQVTAPEGTEEHLAQMRAQDLWDKEHPAERTRLGSIVHGLAKAGEIGANIVAPGLTYAIPGTQAYRRLEEERAEGAATREQARTIAAGNAKATQAATEAETGLRKAETAEKTQQTEKQGLEQSLEKDAEGNVTGWKDPQGRIHGLDEEGTPQGIKDVAEAEMAKPTIEKMDNGDIVSITPGKNGEAPKSTVVYHGDPKLETDLTTRTVGGKEHHILVNKKTGADIKDLGEFKGEVSPAALLAQEKAGEEVVLAYDKDNKAHIMSKADAVAEGMQHITKAQPGDVDKAKTHHAVLNTLQTQLNSVVNSSKALDQGIVQRGIIASALSHPENTTIDSAMRAAVMSGATEQTKDYVIAVLALREAGLALPKEITGGSRVAEIQASALWQTMPSAASLNSKYALKQSKKFQQDIDRLRERAPDVRGVTMVDPDEAIKTKGEKQHTVNAPAGAAGGGPPGPPAAGMKWQQNNKTKEYRQVPVSQ